MKSSWISFTFWASAVYDMVLGVTFLFAAKVVFAHYQVPLPNHLGYIHFPAIILIIFGVMFARIAMHPGRLRECMLYGVGLKIAYSGTVFYHHASGGVPAMWLPFAYVDCLFVVAFMAAWRATKSPS